MKTILGGIRETLDYLGGRIDETSVRIRELLLEGAIKLGVIRNSLLIREIRDFLREVKEKDED